MARRRMFSRDIVTKTKFLMMPATARLLYYDLGMRADDDGVVEAYGVMRETGAREDDLMLLVSKGLIVFLDQAELVVWIKDWKENNQLRPDRYVKGQHHELLVSMFPEAEVSFKKKKEELPEPVDSSPSEGEEKPDVSEQENESENLGLSESENSGIPMVYQMDTNGIHSKGKVSIGKDSKEKKKAPVGAASFLGYLCEETEGKYSEELKAAVFSFCEMRKKKRQPLNAERAIKRCAKRLAEYSGGSMEQMIAILDYSTDRGYVDIYPPKEHRQPAQAQNQPQIPDGFRLATVGGVQQFVRCSQ